MKKTRRIVFMLAIVCMACSFLTACTSMADNPIDIIRDAYGDTEYSISFNSEGMDEAIESVQYTANSIPKLPTPTRLGYIFEGWYFDREYTLPYSDTYLLLYMCDVTLYAKWSQEEMVQSGIYEISFSASIVEGSERNKGALVDEYGYVDFCDAIIEEETYIEKAGDDIFLKLQYDAGYVVPLTSAPVYSVSVNSPYSVKLSSENTIDSAADTTKTLYFDIAEFIEDTNMNDPIYFTVTAYNWETEGLTVAQRAQTNITYTVEFQITEFAGFSQSYVNTDTQMDDGYYLVESYYTSIGGDESMGNSFNPVYSYLAVEDGNYTLIKPFSPYIGMMSDTENFTQNISNFFDRGTAFSAIQLWYGVTLPSNGTTNIDVEYLPDYYNGGVYGEYAIEYHADTGRFYSIYDFGDTLYSALHVNAAISGYMEYTGSIGWVDLIVTLDLDHVLRLAEIDYEPLEGDAYQYADEMQFYAGDLSDLNEYNLTYDAVEQYGLSTDYINFFWSAKSATSSYSDRIIHSSRISFSAQDDTAGVATSDSRYRIAHFNVVSEIYGYNCLSDDLLFADITTAGTFGGVSLRNTKQIITGKSEGIHQGEQVNITELYKEKVDPSFTGIIGATGSEVTYAAYAVVNGKPDYSSLITINGNAFEFSQDIAIVFHSKKSGEQNVTAVILQEEQEPDISIRAGSYDEQGQYIIGDTVPFPILTYSWFGQTTTLYDKYYLTSQNSDGVNPIYAGVYTVNTSATGNDSYSLSYISVEQTTFQMSSENMSIVYVLENKFDEIRCIYYEYSAAQQGNWQVTLDDSVLASGLVTYGDAGDRNAISANDTNAEVIGQEDIASILERNYVLYVGSSEIPLKFTSHTIKTRETSMSSGQTETAYDSISDAIEEYPYVFIELNYTSEFGDRYAEKFICGVTFYGKSELSIFNHDTIFTGVAYTENVPQILSSDSLFIANGSAGARRIDGYTETLSGISSSSGSITFNNTGTYRVFYTYTFGYDENGDKVFAGYETVTITFSRVVEVHDGAGMVTIVYHTDEDHPFVDAFGGGTSYSVNYNLGTSTMVNLIGDQYFVTTSDRLYGWTIDEKYTYRDSEFIFASGQSVEYLSSFGALEIHLYPIWDKGLIVSAELSTEIENVSVVNVTTGTNTELIYLSTTGLNRGKFVISLSSFQVANLPAGYELVGWTIDGEFVPQANIATYSYVTLDDTPITITAEIRQMYSVTFIVDRTYSTTFFQPTTAYEGEYVSLPWAVTLNDPENYRLVGWNVMIDGEYVMEGEEYLLIEDVSDYAINGNVTFIAVFGPIGE